MNLRSLAAVLLLPWLTGCGAAEKDGTAATAAGAAGKAEKAGGGSGRPRDLETFMAIVDIATYKAKVAPAFELYISFGDPSGLHALLSPDSPGLPKLDDRKKRLQAALKLAPAVMEAKCLVRLPGLEPLQLGSNSELVSYLYSASDWLRETLTSKDISDLTLDYPVGEHTEIIRPADAAEIRVNIRNTLQQQPADANIKAQLASLLTFMDAVEKNPNYALALVMK